MKKQTLLIALGAAITASLATAASVRAADTVKSVKVFILAGQSNMEGKAANSLLDYQAKAPGTKDLFKHLRKDGKWIVRDDVFIKYLGRKGPLTIGYGSPGCTGVELEFGTLMGDHFHEPVLLIKAAWGGHSLVQSFRSPSAGYRYPIAKLQTQLENRQKQVKQKNEKNKRSDPLPTMDDLKKAYGPSYRAMLTEVKKTFDNYETMFPALKGKKLELAGFVWFQGWNDMNAGGADKEYASNMKHFIKDVRKDLGAPNLPFVIAAMGQNGSRSAGGELLTIRKAQLSMNNVPEFKGNVKAFRTDLLVDKKAERLIDGWEKHREEWTKVGSNWGYHYYGSALWFNRIGKAMGEAMLELTSPDRSRKATNTITWSQHDVTSPTDILGGAAGVLAGSAQSVDSATKVNGIEYALLPAATLGLKSGGFPRSDIGNLSDYDLNKLFRTSGYGAGPMRYTITGATPGKRYRAQFFVLNLSWQKSSTMTVTLEGANSPAWVVAASGRTPDTGRLLQAEWTQDAGDTTVDFTLTKSSGGEGVQLSGFVVHALGAAGSEPSKRPAKPVGKASDQRDARMKWWREAKFGLFIHWGLYAVPAGEWGGKKNYGEWIMCHCKIPVKEYAKLATKFNPVKFDAKAWVRMAKDAGMKYIVITAKHHDGFAMFRSKADPFNIYDATPFKRDPLKDLAAECRKQGIKLGFYYSQAQDWHQPGADAVLGRWDKAQNGNFDVYLRKVVLPHLKELMTNYGPVAVLWWDTATGSMTPDRTDQMKGVLKLQPGIITNNRLGGKNPGDTYTSEQKVPPNGVPGKDWESCMTMGAHWGYNKNDTNLKSSTKLIRTLIDIVSKGGNYLLNVGPTAEGLFPEHNIQRLTDIGKWMKVNGEAIYGTTRSGFPTAPAWGRVTQKPDKLYLHVWNWPKNGKLVVPGLTAKVKTAYILADANRAALKTTANTGGVEVAVGAQAPDAIASVVVLEIETKP